MDPDLQVQYAAVKGLANFGNKALPAKDKLINAMNRGTPEMRRVAIDVLANLGEEADDVIPDLVTALSDFDVNVQWAAIQALRVKGNKAVIFGSNKLNGAELMATDLRASVSLILAALTAKGKSTINRIYHLDRGYEDIEKKLRKIGAKIRRISF